MKIGQERLPWLTVAGLVLIGLGGLFARLLIVGDSVVADEGSTWFVVSNRGFFDMLDYVRGEQEVSPPLYFALAWIGRRFGDAGVWMRAPSLVVGVATVPLTYVLGRLTVGHRAGLVGACLITISPFMIFYSTEARPYALLVFTVLLSSIALVMALRTRRTAWWVGFALACAAVMYTHYTGLFVLFAQFLWALFLFPESRKKLVLAGVGAALLYLPWVAEYRADSESEGSGIIGAILPFSYDRVPELLANWSYGQPIGEFAGIPGTAFEIVLGLGILIGLVGVYQRIREGVSRERLRMWLLPIVLAIATPLGTILYSDFSVSVFLIRNQAASTIGLALVVAAIVSAPRNRTLRWTATGMVLMALAVSTINSLEPDQQRIDFKAAAEYIGETDPGSTTVIDASESVPAPNTGLDIAMDEKDLTYPTIRLDRPTYEEQAALLAPGGAGRFTDLPKPTPQEVADRAIAESDGPGDRIVLVATSFGLIDGVRLFNPAVYEFEEALKGRADLVETRELPGNPGGVQVKTYEITKK